MIKVCYSGIAAEEIGGSLWFVGISVLIVIGEGLVMLIWTPAVVASTLASL